MALRILAKNIELNADAEAYIRKKLNRLEHHLKSISDSKVEVSRTSARSQADRFVAQMTIATNGYTLRGEESGLNLFGAIDAVADVMDRQIQRYKGKAYRSGQAKRLNRASSASTDGSAPAPGEEIATDAESLTAPNEVVKTKRFPMKPMTVEDAITDMELLGHGFFFFYNVESDEFNVVYRRHDGRYGVIEPSL